MALYPYVATLAVDPVTLVKAAGATGTIFAPEDTGFASPLTATDATGNPIPLTANADGILPSFYSTSPAVNWRSGSYTFPLVTSQPLPGPEGAPGERGNDGQDGRDGSNVIPTAQAIAAEIETPGTPANAALSATVAGKVDPEKATRRRTIRATGPAPFPATAQVTFPTTGGLAGTGFSWTDAPIKVYEFAGDYVTNFEPEGAYPLPLGKTVYVDTVTGLSTNDGLTEAAPCQSIAKALTLVVDGDQIVLLDKDVIFRAGGFSGTKVTKSIRMRAKNPGLIVACADNLAYTKTAGANHVYQSARTNVIDVVDMGVFWSPDGYKLPKVTSLAACDSTPGSWWHDGTNVYVHTADNKAPDSRRVFATLAADNLWVESSGASELHVFVQGIRFLGGSDGLVVNATTSRANFYARDCGFLHGSGINATRANSCNFMGPRHVFMRNCKAVGSKKDGFNYAAYNNAGALKDAPKAIEVDCEAYDHGLDGTNGDTCNASTGHSGSKVIRVRGKGHHTRGAIFADVQTGTQSLNFGCVGYDSLSATIGSSSIFHAQQAGADMWVYGGEGFGAETILYANTGTWVGYKGITPDTLQGGGTRVQLT